MAGFLGQGKKYGHYYTTDQESDNVPDGYMYDKIACRVIKDKAEDDGTVPIYSFYHPNGDHFYCIDSNGENCVANGYEAKGIAFYVYPSEADDTVEFHRFRGRGAHFYTTERDAEKQPDYVHESVLGWVLPAEVTSYEETFPLYRWSPDNAGADFKFKNFDEYSDRKIRRVLREAYDRLNETYEEDGKITDLTPEEVAKLKSMWFEDITFDGFTEEPWDDEAIGGKAHPTSRYVVINTLVFNSDIEDKAWRNKVITNRSMQVLLHQLMHCAGYEHQDETTYDGYWETPPLRAERICSKIFKDKKQGKWDCWLTWF